MRAYRIIIPILVGTSLAASPAAAAEEAAVPSKRTVVEADAKDGGKGERLICKRFPSTESRMKSFKACHTAAEWKRIDEQKY